MKSNMLRFLGAVALVGSTGCLPTYDPSAPQTQLPPAERTGPDNSATRVSNQAVPVRPQSPSDQVAQWQSQGDPTQLNADAQTVGPLIVSSKQHACQKMRYETLGRLLQNRGVNMNDLNSNPLLPVSISTDCSQAVNPSFRNDPNVRASYVALVAQPANFLYCDSRLTLGLPQYSARFAEINVPTTASATKLFDVFIAAAPEIIKNISTLASCKVNGKGAVLFNTDGSGNVTSCDESGITCIQGYPATADQVALCTRVAQQIATNSQSTPAKTVTLIDGEQASAPAISAIETGKQVAVASIMSAAHFCE